jgi:hypothetical protein
VIGTATPGAELQVKKNENGWIQFVDPSSGNSGWVKSNVVADAKGSTDAASVASEEAQSANLKKDKPAKKAAKQKPPSADTAHPRSKPDGRYAELPNDDEFLADRGSRRMGFARRRMLREGLMSPGFLPP